MASEEERLRARYVAIITDGNGRWARQRGLPELTEERRRELVKVVRGIAEEGRVAIRNVRRDCMHDLRELRDEGEVGADDEHRAEVELQKLTDEKIGEIDSSLAAKEDEILQV